MRARGTAVTIMWRLRHRGALAVAVLAALASLAVSAVVGAGLRAWVTNGSTPTRHLAVIGAPLPGSSVVTVPAPPARHRNPAPTAAAPPATTPTTAGASTTPAVPRTAPLPAPPAIRVPPAAPAIGPFAAVAALVPSVNVAGPVSLRALLTRRPVTTQSIVQRLRPQWLGVAQAAAPD